jgi:hypothetical protein
MTAQRPLKRRSDRIQAAVRVLLVAALLAAAPLAAWEGARTHARLEAVVAEQARVLTAVRANVLVGAVAWPAASSYGGEWTTVAWTTTSGATRTAVVLVPSEPRAEQPVTVWVDRHGHPVAAPRDEQSITDASVSAGVTALAVLVVGPLVLYLAVVLLLNRWRGRLWSTEWAAIEPDWTRHLL